MRPYANVRFERVFGGWLRRSHKRPNAAFVIRRQGTQAFYSLLTFIRVLPRGSASPLGLIPLSDNTLSPFVSLLVGRFTITKSPALSARGLRPFFLNASLPSSAINVTR